MSANIAKAVEPLAIVIDTNVLISGLLFGGRPRQLLNQVNATGIVIITSETLIAELKRVLLTKFKITLSHWRLIEQNIRSSASLVASTNTIRILKDEPDNRLLEAAVAGGCSYIVTGDKLLLALGNYEKVKVLNVNQFLNLFF